MVQIMDVISGEPEWLERTVFKELRVWHVIFLCLAGVTSLIVMVCCCFRFRIPRTKQQIEANYKRRKITTKFRHQLETIQDSKMDAISLKDGTSMTKTLYARVTPAKSVLSDMTEINGKLLCTLLALELLHEKSQAMDGENQQGSQASSIVSPQQSSLEASFQPEGGQKPEPQVSGMNFVKFATKVAHLSKLQPKSPTSPPPTGSGMDF